MTERDGFERRIAALIEGYADQAPIDVDAVAMTRHAAAVSGRPAFVWFGFMPVGRGLAFALALLVLMIAIAAGALMAGERSFRPDPVEILADRAFVEPFVGLPPVGVAPSTPETAPLVLSFNGRVRHIGMEFHRVWLFADGRLIWKRNLDVVTDEGEQAFGTHEPTTAVIEQRLTPEGVELMRSRVMAAGLHDIQPADPLTDRTTWHRPGVLWGGLVVHDGDRLVDAYWSDSELPELLADPASWVPASAWADPRVGAYVPSRYAVCLQQDVPGAGPAELLEFLPEPTENLIRAKAIDDPIREWHEEDRRCLFDVSHLDVAAIAGALGDAGLRRNAGIDLSFSGIEVPSSAEGGVIQLLVVVPNGEVVCYCG